MSTTTDYTRTAADLRPGVDQNPGTWINSQHAYQQLEVQTVERSHDGRRVVVQGLYRNGRLGVETWQLTDRVTLTLVGQCTDSPHIWSRAPQGSMPDEDRRWHCPRCDLPAQVQVCTFEGGTPMDSGLCGVHGYVHSNDELDGLAHHGSAVAL